MVESPATPRLVRFGVFELDLRTGELRKAGIRISLQEQPLQVLTILLERPPLGIAHGVHEALITDLAKLSGLKRVIARASVMRYENTDRPLREIAQELGVDALVTGAAVQAGGRVRVTAQVVRRSTEELLWTERYEREYKDVIALQGEIVEAIAQESRHHLNQHPHNHYEKPVDSFEQARARDPGYAPAHASLAYAYGLLGGWGNFAPRDWLPKAKVSALKAIELDDRLAEAHVSLAWVTAYYDWDWRAAEREFTLELAERAASLSSDHGHVGIVYGLAGRRQRALQLLNHLLERRKRAYVPPIDIAQLYIIHCDLKPANVKVTPEGRVKVLDFGLAFAGGNRSESDPMESPTISKVASPGGVAGTPAYMSPEQARGQALDKRTDIWSFGCLLYETLTAHRAFPDNTTSDTLVAVLEREPDWGALPGSTPAKIRALIERCTRKDRGQRLHDIADARIELQEALADPVPGTLAGVEGLARPRRRRWLAAGLAAGLAAILLLVGAGYLLRARHWSRPQDSRAPVSLAVLPFHVVTAAASDQELGVGLADDIITHLANIQDLRVRPTQSVVAYQGSALDVQQAGQALKADALAYAGLSMASAEMHLRFAPAAEVQAWGERAKREGQRAVSLDANVAETHLGLAAVYGKAEFEWDKVIEESRRALELNPRLQRAYAEIARAFHHLGLLEAADKNVRQALALDPENRSEAVRSQGVTAIFAGRFTEAVTLLEEVQRISGRPLTDTYLAQAYYYSGETIRGETALARLSRATSAAGATRARATLASFLAARGERSEAESLVGEVTAGSYTDHHVAYSLSAAYAQLGHAEEAVRWLRRAAETGFPCHPCTRGIASLHRCAVTRSSSVSSKNSWKPSG